MIKVFTKFAECAPLESSKNALRDEAIRIRSDYWSRYKRRLNRSIWLSCFSSRDKETLRELVKGKCGGRFLPSSNLRVQSKAADILWRVLDNYVRQHPERATGSTRFHLGTFLFNDCMIPPESPVFMLHRIKDRIRNALASNGLHGIMFLEFAWTKPPSNLGARSNAQICMHVHGLIWPDEPGSSVKATTSDLRSIRGFEPIFGCPSVTLKANQAHGSGSLCKMANYVLKIPATVKRIVPTKKDSSKFKLRDNGKDLTGNQALRLIEIYSQLDIAELCFSVGDAKHIRAEWKRQLRQAFSRRGGTEFEADRISLFWTNVTRQKSKAQIIPVAIHRKNQTPRKGDRD